ncbi:hypothetical protein DFH28DRAFT_910425, partial [Melampsora americana]
MDDINPEFLPIPNDEPPIGIVDGQGQQGGHDVVAQFVAQHRELRYADHREQLRKNWEAIENHLTAAYLESQTNTLNWTSKESYLDNVSDVCHCAEGHFYYRNIDLIGVLSRFESRPVRFCHCLPEPVQLVYQGYLPASPQQPRTAFFIPLLQIYQNLWQTSVSAATSWIEGYMNFLDGRSEKEDTARGSDGTRRRDLCDPFLSATNIYSRI